MSCDSNPATSVDRPITADIYFLMELGRLATGRASSDVAKAWFQCVMLDFPNAADRADERINHRIGQGLTKLGAWDVADPDCPGCELLSKGLLLSATNAIRTDPVVRAARTPWFNDLVATQQPDGSWNGDTQTTAYALIGIATLHAYAPDAVNKAAAFLRSMQHPDGGFAVDASQPTTEITEVDSEAMRALRAAP